MNNHRQKLNTLLYVTLIDTIHNRLQISTQFIMRIRQSLWNRYVFICIDII